MDSFVRAALYAGALSSCLGGSDPVEAPDPVEEPPPDTSIEGPGPIAESPVTFTLASREGATFECSLDGADFAACPSPITFDALELGAHRVEARATDALGTDPTPASADFTVVERADFPNLAVLEAGDAYGPERADGYWLFDHDRLAEELVPFYDRYPDDYDAIVTFTQFPVLMLPFARTLRFDVRGVGFEERYGAGAIGTDFSSEAGSAGELDGLVFMCDEAFWDRVAADDGEREILYVLAQEFGHRWAAYLPLPGDADPDVLRDTTGTHWSFTVGGLDAPSPMQVPDGFTLTDNADGTFLLKKAPLGASYASLDLYVMGLLPATDVPDFWFVRNPIPDMLTIDAWSDAGMTISGERTPVSFQDVVTALGPRVPSVEDAPKSFRTAFVAVVLPGTEPDPAFLEFVDQTRVAWESYFSETTRGLGNVDTALFDGTRDPR